MTPTVRAAAGSTGVRLPPHARRARGPSGDLSVVICLIALSGLLLCVDPAWVDEPLDAGRAEWRGTPPCARRAGRRDARSAQCAGARGAARSVPAARAPPGGRGRVGLRGARERPAGAMGAEGSAAPVLRSAGPARAAPAENLVSDRRAARSL